MGVHDVQYYAIRKSFQQTLRHVVNDLILDVKSFNFVFAVDFNDLILWSYF